MLSQLIGRLFNRHRASNSRSAVKQRLQLVIAHDRAALSPETVESMQKEILAVVSRYVEIDTSKLNFSLESRDRMTSITANLPIRRIHKTPLDPDVVAEELRMSGMAIETDGAGIELVLEDELELDEAAAQLEAGSESGSVASEASRSNATEPTSEQAPPNQLNDPDSDRYLDRSDAEVLGDGTIETEQ